MNLPINFLGLISYLLFKEKKNKKIFYYFFVPGLIYSFFCHTASNVEIHTISSSLIVCSTASIVFIISTFFKLNNNKIKVLFILFIIGFSSIYCYERYIWVFSHDSIKNQKNYIEDGPYQGVIVNNNFYEEYNHDIEITNYINDELDGESIVYLTYDNNWMYLMTYKFKMASPCPWYTMKEYCIPDLNKYYSYNKDKQPDIICVEDSYLDNFKNLEILDNYELNKQIYDKYIYKKKGSNYDK